MGSVYVGEDPDGHRVAVKVIRPDLVTVSEFRARFRSEVKRARQVPSFCTAGVLDADVEHPTPYLVVEYVDGVSLADVVGARGPLTGGNLHSVAIGMAVALVAIHDAGVVHRDLKPSNVLLSAGTTKVIDFGIARALDASSEHTLAGHVVGTLAYMAPERFPGHPGGRDGRPADIFAWAAVVLFAATGQTPSVAEIPFTDQPDLPDLDALPHPLRDLVATALQPNPAERPTAHRLLDRLLDAGAHGNEPIRAGLQQQPQLRRAAAAVRHTVQDPIEHAVRRTVRRHARADTTATTSAVTGQGTGRLPGSRFGRRRAVSMARTVVAASVMALLGMLVGVGASTYHDGAVNDLNGAGTGPTAADSRDSGATGRAGRGADRGGCILDGQLELTTTGTTPFRCPAPSQPPTSRSIDLRLRLDTPSACAAIRLDLANADDYRIAICADRISVDIERDTEAHTLAFTEIVPALVVGSWYQISVQAHPGPVTVKLNGAATLTKPGLNTGAAQAGITVGILTTGGATADTAHLTIADIEVISSR
jgi:hypothetical protein